MVYLRGISIKMTMSLLILIIFVEAAPKFAYKKPIHGKTTNAIKDKHLKVKPEVTKKMTVTTTTTTTSTPAIATTEEETNSAVIVETTMATVERVNTTPNLIAEAPKITTKLNSSESARVSIEEMETNSSLEVKTEPETEPINQVEDEIVENEDETTEAITEELDQQQVDEQVAAPVLDLPSDLESTTSTPVNFISTTTTMTTERKEPVPCTCGVFLTSQIKRGSGEPPHGKPVIVNELERNFPCTAVGQKQCQTKCLETIVQHLPNSANILCATLNRDCRKERAYLFIKNCRNQWINTNLAAGREYCCKNGQPYTCPMV